MGFYIDFRTISSVPVMEKQLSQHQKKQKRKTASPVTVSVNNINQTVNKAVEFFRKMNMPTPSSEHSNNLVVENGNTVDLIGKLIEARLQEVGPDLNKILRKELLQWYTNNLFEPENVY